jgi:hypothetical protein
LRRFWLLALIAAAPLAGCRIEQTPEEYFDHQLSPAEEREASREELSDRLRAMNQALRRASRAEVFAALAPTSDVFVFGPEPEHRLTSPAAVVAALEEIVGRDTEVLDLNVTVGPRNNVAWFRTTLVSGTPELPEIVRFSGVFIRSEGEWRLTEGHLSRAVSPAPGPPDGVGIPQGAG